MAELDGDGVRPRSRGKVARALRVVRAFGAFLGDAFIEDVRRVAMHARLFVGIVLSIVGVLSFASDRYCDGNTSSYYACTRPATYYYYPWWAIVLIVLGVFSLVLWSLRTKKSR